MTELEASGTGESPPPYMIFLVVFLFFLTGLLGFLICHLLKKKGYRCRTGDLEDEEEEEKLEENEDDENDENQDTVEQILKCIIENEANMEAFNEMLGNHNVCVRHDPRLRKESIGGVPPHLHTVHSGTDHNSCLLCTQVRSKKGRRQSRTPRFKQRPGEQTVFSVGRFRVTHTDKKLPGGPNPLAVSGDQLDLSQDSEDRKEGGYNLKSMFKEVRPPSEGANGVAANLGKPKKNVTIFGLRRGSDPLGLKVKEGTGRETGAVRFSFQKPPIVLEEPLQAENFDPEQNKRPAVRTVPASVSSPSAQSKKLDHVSNSGPQEGSKTVTETPTSLAVLPEIRVNVDNKMLKTEEAPLQTSTPISPMPASILGSTSANPPKLYSDKGSVVPQTSSDPCLSPDQEVGTRGGLAIISLGSSPQISFPNKTLSSVSSLKSPTSSLAESPSPKSISKSMVSETADQNLSSTGPPPPTLNLEDVMSVTSATKGDIGSFSVKEQKPERQTTLKTNGNTEIKRTGILKTAKQSPDVLKGSGLSSPSDQGLRSLPLSPCSPLSPSSPKGSRISSVAIVKASPDSKREFSVVTLLDEEEPSPSPKNQKKESAGGEEGKCPAVSQQGDFSVSGGKEGGPALGANVRPALCPEKDDLMEMEDIKDCKVTHVGGAERMEEEGEERMKMMMAQFKQNQQVKSPKNEKFDSEEGKNID
ncbi:RELT-like protein 2 [Kryptolebias marmoratus]|uniref:Uncharacterized LOC108240042 n=1 Tax=Kryptolebias marmoratus TaxID=37003 RepID=A0A3Q3A2K5_KRYMA|nr:RELT-like protein 2 [Kryptolebias marmoratus]XP_037833343.1 RELT-like protein 2 [Kryptolebias marmoratus]